MFSLSMHQMCVAAISWQVFLRCFSSWELGHGGIPFFSHQITEVDMEIGEPGNQRWNPGSEIDNPPCDHIDEGPGKIMGLVVVGFFSTCSEEPHQDYSNLSLRGLEGCLIAFHLFFSLVLFPQWQMDLQFDREYGKSMLQFRMVGMVRMTYQSFQRDSSDPWWCLQTRTQSPGWNQRGSGERESKV